MQSLEVTSTRKVNGTDKMTNVVVYSCVTGSYDKLDSTFFASANVPEPGVRYVVFSDKQTSGRGKVVTSEGVEWDVLPLAWKHSLCRTRTARWHKLHPGIITKHGDISIWVDASQRITAKTFVSDLLEATVYKTRNVDIFSFKHPQRSCIYQELHACLRLKKDNPELMKRQIELYRKMDYPAFNGLVETACVVRKNTNASLKFDQYWWYELDNHSLRDQLSFNYVAWKTKIPYGHIPGCRANSPFFCFISHGS